MMGMCENVWNEIVFVMDYLMEMYNFTIVSFHFLLIKKNILYLYKITIVPFIKMLNFQSAFITSLGHYTYGYSIPFSFFPATAHTLKYERSEESSMYYQQFV